MAKASKTKKKSSDNSRTARAKSDKSVAEETKAGGAGNRPDENAIAAEPKGFGLRLMDVMQNEGVVHHELIARIEQLTQYRGIPWM